MEKKILKDTAVFGELAKYFVDSVKATLKKKERATVVLSGGTTPRSYYKKLVSDKYKDQVDWTRIDFFFGDERDVSPMSEKSNFKMADESLFKPLGIESSQVFRWQTEIIEVQEVARSYEKTIVRYFGLGVGDLPRFDLTILGMGDDGHTASLFPGTLALDVSNRLCVANRVEKFDSNRLTMTYPVINNSERIVFAVTGEGKAPALSAVLEGPDNLVKFPAQGIKPTNGSVLWLIGNSAAGGLSGRAAGR